jgi:hypothetical protein
MNEAAIAQYITETFPGVEAAESFGYTLFFYRSERKLPFATIASSDNEHDTVSRLDRPGVFRLNIGVSKQTFQWLFGSSAVDTGHYDYTALDQFMPHPDYAAWHFICILNPSDANMAKVKEFLAGAYDVARCRAGSSGCAHPQTA